MDLLRGKEVKTLKPHICLGCCRKFPKGIKMRFEVWANEGTVYNSYLCETCQEVINELANEYGSGFEFSEGELREETIEYEQAQSEAKLKEQGGGE